MSEPLPKHVQDQVARAEELRKGRRQRTVLIPYKASAVERRYMAELAALLAEWMKQRA